MQVYELITCVGRANENARNLISIVRFLIICYTVFFRFCYFNLYCIIFKFHRRKFPSFQSICTIYYKFFLLNCNEPVSESHNLLRNTLIKKNSAFWNIGQNNIYSFYCVTSIAFSPMQLITMHVFSSWRAQLEDSQRSGKAPFEHPVDVATAYSKVCHDHFTFISERWGVL